MVRAENIKQFQYYSGKTGNLESTNCCSTTMVNNVLFNNANNADHAVQNDREVYLITNWKQHGSSHDLI
jgi:hypothetical protein